MIGQTRPRRLLLCLDGVPHKLIEEERGRGLFDSFGPPSRLLSPFPTMTNVALSAMLGATPPAGYESLYFDRKARELRGGISKYVGRRTPDKVPSSYMDDLDYQEPLPFEFLIYVAPKRSGALTCDGFANASDPRPKIATTLRFSKRRMVCCTPRGRSVSQLHSNRSTRFSRRFAAIAAMKRRS